MENIKIELLEHHPRNPRKEIGDVTELADSIRANGIMQNLTVVPHENKYYVVIGNRRLEAAKLAGLTELPCQVVNMTEKEQQSTMLLENMQRVDLTPYEQAEGFQMCLDLGMNEDELKESTGFSKKTIKHRLNLLKLDKEEFKKSMDAGGTMQDYIDLEKIEDIEVKNDLLQYIGTNSFRYNLNNAISKQERDKVVDKLISELEKVMERKEKRPDGYEYSSYLYSITDCKNYKIPDDVNERKYVFIVNEYGNTIYIYREFKKEENIVEDKKEEPDPRELAVAEIKEKVGLAYKTRLEFAKGIYETLMPDMKKNIEIKYLFDLENNYLDSCRFDYVKIFREVTGKEIKDVLSISDTLFESYKNCIRLLFAYIYANLDTDSTNMTVNEYKYDLSNFGTYNDSYREEFQSLYDFLSLYGYEPSEEEKAIMFGTHELYAKNNE